MSRYGIALVIPCYNLGRTLEEALEIYQVLFGFFPDEVEYGLHLAQAQTAVGKGGERVGDRRQAVSLWE